MSLSPPASLAEPKFRKSKKFHESEDTADDSLLHEEADV